MSQKTHELLLAVEDELCDLQSKFHMTLCDEILMEFKENLKSTAK